MTDNEESKKDTKKLTFKQQMMIAREQAIIETANKLLASKGYDAMTVDEVADQVGIAKASLYKHFSSKEALAVAAMAHLMEKAVEHIKTVDEVLTPVEKLKSITQWALRLKQQGDMPNLPSQNSVLRKQLISNEDYMGSLMYLSDVMGAWIEAAQEQGTMNNDIPAHVILLTLYARACDPVLGFLQQSGLYEEDQIIDLVTTTCFNGIC